MLQSLLRTPLRTFLFAFCLSISAIWTASHSLAQDKTDGKKPKVNVQQLLQKGQEAYEDEKFEESVKIFQQIVDAEPDFGAGWMMLGLALHSNKELDKALVAHAKSAEFDEFKQTGFYNQGCVYAMQKNADKAFEFLNKAVSVGFRQVEQYDSDADLDNIREDARFKKLMYRVKNNGREMFELDDLVGEWTFKSGKRAGKEIEGERLQGTAKFTKEKVTIPAGPDSTFVMKFKINTEKRIPQIDLEIESGPVSEGKAVGLIKMEEGKLHLCYEPTGEKRPTKFDSTEENGCFYFVLEKKTN